MAIVQCHNRKSGITYVYDSVCFFDDQQGKYRYKRKLLGKLDPETGEMVPTGKRGGYYPRRDKTAEPIPLEPLKPGRKKKAASGAPSVSDAAILETFEKLKAENKLLEERITFLERKMDAREKKHQAFVAEHNRFIQKLQAIIPPLAEASDTENEGGQ